MRRILVVSDSHGRNENVRIAIEDAVKKGGPIDAMIHLGDVGMNFHEVSQMAGVSTYIVRGNCDSAGELMDRNIIKFGTHTVYATHGHRQQVQYGLDTLRYVALQNECDIALFGHTHVPCINEGSDVSFYNPGSVTLPRQGDHKATYGILEIGDDASVKFEICYL